MVDLGDLLVDPDTNLAKAALNVVLTTARCCPSPRTATPPQLFTPKTVAVSAISAAAGGAGRRKPRPPSIVCVSIPKLCVSSLFSYHNDTDP